MAKEESRKDIIKRIIDGEVEDGFRTQLYELSRLTPTKRNEIYDSIPGKVRGKTISPIIPYRSTRDNL
jgi:hypothetical protein